MIVLTNALEELNSFIDIVYTSVCLLKNIHNSFKFSAVVGLGVVVSVNYYCFLIISKHCVPSPCFCIVDQQTQSLVIKVKYFYVILFCNDIIFNLSLNDH